MLNSKKVHRFFSEVIGILCFDVSTHVLMEIQKYDDKNTNIRLSKHVAGVIIGLIEDTPHFIHML